MSSPNKNPKWWQLYLIFPLLIILFVVDSRLEISTSSHQVVQIGIVFFVYGFVHLWLKANTTALSKMDQPRHHDTIVIIQASQRSSLDSDESVRPLFQLPELEVKGMLSDTFEMDCIDADLLPIDEVFEELNKE